MGVITKKLQNKKYVGGANSNYSSSSSFKIPLSQLPNTKLKPANTTKYNPKNDSTFKPRKSSNSTISYGSSSNSDYGSLRGQSNYLNNKSRRLSIKSQKSNRSSGIYDNLKNVISKTQQNSLNNTNIEPRYGFNSNTIKLINQKTENQLKIRAKIGNIPVNKLKEILSNYKIEDIRNPKLVEIIEKEKIGNEIRKKEKKLMNITKKNTFFLSFLDKRKKTKVNKLEKEIKNLIAKRSELDKQTPEPSTVSSTNLSSSDIEPIKSQKLNLIPVLGPVAPGTGNKPVLNLRSNKFNAQKQDYENQFGFFYTNTDPDVQGSGINNIPASTKL
jgi:hypothetical protein